MPRSVITLALQLALTLPLAGQGERAATDRVPPRYRVTWWDAPSVVTAGALALVPVAAGLPTGRSPCAPCDPSTLFALDRVALHTFSGAANTASNVLLVGVTGLSGLASLEGASAAQVRGHVVVFANSLAWSLATTEWLKVLFHRGRPVLYVTGDTAAASDVENRRSFPSGHAALAFAAATTYFAIARREHLPHRTRNAIVLFGGAVAVSALRVAGGKHFPTDVAAGAALGAGIGWLAARLHPATP
ncbi:MAG TPA: phosphatase PAP2 family protein [Gemmatimonadales bacterium]|nr:phosphatase PAP2 family protein [Gemmatimonadales bacterium]